MYNNIINIFNRYNIKLTDGQAEQFRIYLDFLLQENQKFNLTAITDPNEVIVKHFIDSILPMAEFPQNAKVVDVGSGAGFPGIPLKILRPDLNITLVDSLQKRVNFLNETIKLLGLDNITAVHARAEDFCADNREAFDISTSRAVAAMPTLCEYLLPLTKTGGMAVCYKGAKAEEELLEAQKAISTLGGKYDKTLEFSLPEVEGKRQIILIKKISHTDKKYPRGKNLPKTKPIL